MTQRYSGVVTRTLERTERRISTEEEETPLVIEPKESSRSEFLRQFLSGHSSELMEDIARHGALLLRGFEVASLHDFEEGILSIRGMRGIDEVLLSEPGRTIVNGTRYVFYTNTMVKTGGALRFPGFHTENFGLTDVPRYISFLCQSPSKLGGETGLVNTAMVYADLPDALKEKLKQRICVVTTFPLRHLVDRYGVTEAGAQAWCDSVGLPLVNVAGTQHIATYLPSVVQHPVTHEHAMFLNLSLLNGIERPLVHAFLPDYPGMHWLLHRLIWRAPSWLAYVDQPDAMVRLWFQLIRQRLSGKRFVYLPGPEVDAPSWPSLFSREDAQTLARIVRRRFSSFLWKRGDILVVDNLKMAHAGMPGRGDRALKAMLCNPVPLPRSGNTPGLHVVQPADEPVESLGAQLIHVRNQACRVSEVAQ